MCCHSLQSPCRSNTPTQIHSLVPPLYKDLSQARVSELPSLCLCTMVASLGGLRLLKYSLSALSCALAESYTLLQEKALTFFARSLYLLAPPCAPWLCGHRGAPFSSPQKGARSTSTVSGFPSLCHELPFIFKNSFWLENSPTPPGHEQNCPKMILGSHSMLMTHRVSWE